jgi:uncharacterized protein (UPF0332 family)
MVQAMSFASDLLEQAHHLARREKRKPKQASLRRAVSTAYYALFHLLVAEAVGNWKRNDQRSKLARAFEHGRMKQASVKTSSGAFDGQHPQTVADLKTVANAFINLQQFRHRADYDNSLRLTRTDALSQIALAADAFLTWDGIRKEKIAQDYLLALLIHR